MIPRSDLFRQTLPFKKKPMYVTENGDFFFLNRRPKAAMQTDYSPEYVASELV